MSMFPRPANEEDELKAIAQDEANEYYKAMCALGDILSDYGWKMQDVLGERLVIELKKETETLKKRAMSDVNEAHGLIG